MQIMAINHSWGGGRDKFWCVSYHHSSYKCLVSIGKANPSIHLCSAAASSPHIHNPHICIKIFSQIWAQSREGDMCNIFWEIWSGSSAMWKENKINIRWKRYLVKEIIDCLRWRYAYIYADQEFSHLHRLRELIKHLSFFFGNVLLRIDFNGHSEHIELISRENIETPKLLMDVLLGW